MAVLCVYLRYDVNLIVESVYRKQRIFSPVRFFEVTRAQPVFLLPYHRSMANVSIPARNHSKAFTPIVFSDETDFDVRFIVGVSIGCTIAFLLLIFFLVRVYLWCRGRDVAEGDSIFPAGL